MNGSGLYSLLFSHNYRANRSSTDGEPIYKLLDELEAWAKELGHIKCVLETGTRQVRAIVFYKKCKYKVIPNYGQYIGMENSVCFEKNI